MTEPESNLTAQRNAARQKHVGEIRRHIFLCCDQTTPKCCDKERSLAAWNYLKRRLEELGLTGASGVYRTKANCLRICVGGPVAVVYPEGAWYGHCDPPVLERIIQEHLIGGCLVREYLIEEHPLPAPGLMTTLSFEETAQRTSTRRLPPLRSGDHLTRDEFERRYRAMPAVHKAELIEGVVYMPSPVSAEDHGEPHFDFITWLGVYRAHTPQVRGGDNATLRLDLDNEPQPDGYLRLLPECGGQARLVDGYVTGAPELIVEIAASSASYDLHEKLNAYRRNGVREYVVWRVWDQAVDWLVLREGRFEPLASADGIYRSEVLPGLWLEPAAVVRGDLARVLQVLHQGLASPEHAAFAASLPNA